MSYPARTIAVFVGYLVLLGITLLATPNLLLTTFGIPPTSEVWIRIVGVLALILAYNYAQAARKEMMDFFPWTIKARAVVIVFFVAFVFLGWVKPVLVLFGAIDLAGAIWTLMALRSSRGFE
jgi:phosphotransferase system  glucose/maltose/N-acetylglucosamine-specific IIC component